MSAVRQPKIWSSTGTMRLKALSLSTVLRAMRASAELARERDRSCVSPFVSVQASNALQQLCQGRVCRPARSLSNLGPSISMESALMPNERAALPEVHEAGAPQR